MIRFFFLLLLMGVVSLSARGDDILFIGNSFTFGDTAPVVKKNGGVPKLVEAIALAEGKRLSTFAVTAGGQNWSYHLAQPATGKALGSKAWNWVVLQDYSTRPTDAGDVKQFMLDGETFSERIAATSPKAGILLFETWGRPPGDFYHTKPGNVFSGPEQMMDEVHRSYATLRDDLAAKNPGRPVRVALVGTAFAQVRAQYPEIIIDAPDKHHATGLGYYLAALVIYDTMDPGGSVHDAPTQFFNGAFTVPPDVAAKLEKVAGEVAMSQMLKLKG